MEEIKNKLTIQEAAPYLGQEIKITEVYYPEDFIYGVGEIVDLDPSILYRMEQVYFTGKLILRSIEDMTEVEKKVFDDMLYKAVFHSSYNNQPIVMAKIVNCLRYIGVDCDNLIGQGKAIRKERGQ